MKVIETIHLTKNYGKTLALKNVNLTIDEGEIFGFVGPNGAGKSTLIKVLLNFIFPSIGSAKIFALNCIKDSAKIKEKVGYVPSAVRYYPNDTAEELLKKTLSFHQNKNIDSIESICETLDIDKSKKFGELSIGNKKKVAIACAIIHEPKLLILDEPTNDLDPLFRKQLFELLKKANQKGATVFISSHMLREVEDLCTRVAFVKEGRILKIEDLTKVRTKSKIIEFKTNSINLKDLEVLGGKILAATEHRVRFSYQGEISNLLECLRLLELTDITIKNASLEDEFLDYYEGGYIDDTFEIGI